LHSFESFFASLKFIQLLVKALLDQAVLSYGPAIQSAIAQRTFKEYFPRLAFRLQVEPNCHEADIAVSDLLVTRSIIQNQKIFLLRSPLGCV